METHSLNDYDYDLPKERIAQFPLEDRTAARLLVCDRRTGTLTDSHIRDLPRLLRPGDTLVLNDSRVIPARITGHREQTGGRWEGLFLGIVDHDAELETARNEESETTGNDTRYSEEQISSILRTESGPIWRLLCKTRGAIRPGEWVVVDPPRTTEPRIRLRMVHQLNDGAWLVTPAGYAQTAQESFELLDRIGRVPLPPYIRHGEAGERDVQTYQTVYAKEPGSVAAPTAGLHFTSELLAEIRQNGVHIEYVTLHVGLGTFRPITTDRIEDHTMHTEWARITPDVAERLERRRVNGGRVIAVGTTAMRTLETAAQGGTLRPFLGETNLFIRPPYTFHAVDATLTNFHFPKTTLLVLVRTFGGDELIRQAYSHAIATGYRFYSYGDAMLIV